MPAYGGCCSSGSIGQVVLALVGSQAAEPFTSMLLP